MQSKYTKEILEPIVASSRSMREVLLALSLRQTGGNYKNIKDRITSLNINLSHFKGQGWSKNLEGKKSTPEEYLTIWNRDRSVHVDKIKKRMLRDKIKPHRCERCGLEKWENFPIPLELHHLNGDRWDNRLENIQFLCPNCHSLTDNFSGKKAKTVSNVPLIETKTFCSCGKEISKNSLTCRKCSNKKNNGTILTELINSGKINTLMENVEAEGIRATARKFGVSHTTIRRWINLRVC